MDDFSVISARDPPITGWRRPKPNDNLVKNLRSIFESEAFQHSSSKQHLKVFLRLKPSLSQDVGYCAASFTILDEYTLSTTAPHESITYKNQGSNVTHQYKFTKIFGPDSCQKQVFDECVADHVTDFVIGNNSLIFAYGTTNAGKTYTVQGTASKPGLVPRALDLLFKRIHGKEAHVGRYKPERVDEIIELDDSSIAQDVRHKSRILQWDWDNHHSDTTRDGEDLYLSSSSDFVSNAFREMQKTISEETTPVEDHKAGDAVFSVWVSYVEIYNDYIYDLLEPIQGIGSKRIPLKLALDANGNVYIRDLRQIHVTSGDEAFQVMLYGKTHLQVASTNMNSSSSRSHSVFTVKLVRYVNTEESPTYARVSSISFCDLAGAERVKKTLNVGDRLKESSNINTSLHVLGRCLTIIKENQGAKYKKQIPFRESKLTRLFQRALQGHESVAMVVNVNSSTVLYDESVHVLKFSAIAKQIVLQTPIKRARRAEKKKSRFSSMALRASKSICWENPSDEEGQSRPSASDVFSADNEALMEKLSQLHEELREEKRKNLTIERDIRISLTEQFSQMMEKNDKKWRERLREAETRNEELSSWRINQLEEYYEDLLNKKRKRSFDAKHDESADQEESIEEKAGDQLDPKELLELKESLEEAKFTIKDLEEALALEKRNADNLKAALKESRQEQDSLAILNSQLKFSLAHTENLAKNNENLLQASNSATTDDYVTELKKQLSEAREAVSAKTKQIESLKILLDEARIDLVMLNKEKEEAEADADSYEQRIAEKIEELNDVASKFEELETVRNEQTKTINAYEQKEMDLSKYEEIIKSLEQELSRANTRYPQKIEELQNQLNALSVKDSTSEEIGEVEAVRSELVAVRKELDEALSKLSVYESLVREKSDLEAKLGKEDDVHLERVKSLEEEKKIVESRLIEKDVEVQSLGKRISSLEDELEELRRTKEDRETLVVSLKEEREAFRDLITGLECKAKKAEELTEKNYCLEAEKEDLLNKIGRWKAELEEKSAQLIALKKTMEEDKASLLSVTKDLEHMVRERETQVKKLEVCLDEFTDWKNQQKEAIAKQLREQEERHEKDLKAVQNDLKKSLQKNVQLEENVRKLEEELRKSHEESSKMEQEVKNALQQSQVAEENRTSTAELVKMLSGAREEADHHKAELQSLLEEKKMLEKALCDKDREFETFTANRDAVVSRYENELKKCKEDAERDRKEIATLTATLYKNTPTPNKKQYEAEIYKLKEQIDALQDRNGNRSDYTTNGMDTSDFADKRKRTTVKKSTASTRNKNSVKGSLEDISLDSLEPIKPVRRTRRKETVESEDHFTVPAAPAPTEEEPEPGTRSSVKRSNRKKLYAPPTCDNYDGDSADPVAFEAEPTTPVVLSKNLRSRSRRI